MTTATRAASLSAVAALVLAAAWFLWPASLGGATTFVSTHGISMEPGFSTGDLAVLRPADTYAVGDVVAYRSETLDTIVMHRIVSGDASGFVTQGDNNDWLDEDRPTQEQVLGSLVLRIPRGGAFIAGLRTPAGLAISAVTGIVVAAVLRPRGRHASQRTRRRPGARSGAVLPRPGSRLAGRPLPGLALPGLSATVRSRSRQVALGAGVAALLSAGGSLLLALTPETQVETTSVDVVQEGAFSYGGQAVAGTTYPSGEVATGDTVWTRLTTDLTVSFTSTISGPDLAVLDGALRLDVSVTASDGWTATLGNSPAAAVVDRTATATVAVDPRVAQELLTAHYAETGAPGGQATLTVTPVAQTLGTARGVPFTAGSPAPLTFAMDATSLRLADPETVLAPTTRTPVDVVETVPRTIPVLGLSVPIGTARSAVAALLAAALLTAGLAAWAGRPVGGPADQFLVRHADRIVPVSGFTPGPALIDVSDAESLHRVAERFDTVVLHHAGPDEDVFVVRDQDATYRLVLPGAAQRGRGRPPVPAPRPAPRVGTRTPGTPPAAAPPGDRTTPLPRALPLPGSASDGLWGRVA
jgi:signal peptidase I